jgi:hypothetical protein
MIYNSLFYCFFVWVQIVPLNVNSCFPNPNMQKKNHVPMVVDKLKKNDVLLIACLKSTDNIRSSIVKKITLKMDSDSFLFSYKKIQIKLSIEEINKFKVFEKEVDSLSSLNKCTAGLHYLFYINGELKKNRIDYSCVNNSFEELLKSLRMKLE